MTGAAFSLPSTIRLATIVFVAAGSLFANATIFGDERLEHFENKIRPVLIAQCLGCHGDDPSDLGGGLSLMSIDDMREGGDTGPAIDGDDATATMLIKAMRYEGEIKMPPDGKLSDDVIRDFEKWIEDGALDPRNQVAKQPKPDRDFNAERQHWAFQPLTASVPVSPVANSSSTIDALIDQSLAAHGLARSQPASPATLLRRVCNDLTGLPPTNDQLTSFLSDPSDANYQRIVDELLASEEFGRHWGRHWLDVARYADSNGSDFNATFHQAWRYRDYVIDSFNTDKPFDRFITEQIAGDLLTSDDPTERTSQLVATGFLMLGPKMLSERDKAKLQMDVVDDQIDTIGRAIMGLTLGCARCHDHKFDPIPTSDYYALAGIFRSTEVLQGEIQKYVSNWIEQPLPANEPLVAAHEAFKKAEKELANEVKKLEAQYKATLALASEQEKGLVIDDVQAKRTGAWVESTYSQPFIGKGYIHDDNRNKGDCSLTFDVPLAAGNYDVALAFTSTANRSRRTEVEITAAGKSQTFTVDQTQKPASPPWQIMGELKLDQDANLQVVIRNKGTDGYVIVDALRFTRTDAQQPAVQDAQDEKLASDAKKVQLELKQAQKRLTELRASKPAPMPKAMAVRDAKTIGDAYVCIRGEVHLKGETVPRGFLQVCQPPAAAESASHHSPVSLPADQSGRLQLAQWLCDPDHPLTARVFVNRVWWHLMGAGLVRTVDNFGLLGARPSHPELLDQLASDFLRNGWSIKRTVRDIVCTDTYRQSSALNENSIQIDPENQWLWRMNRKRRSAESIRDGLLTATHRLDRTPSVAPVSHFGTLVTENVANPKEVKVIDSAQRTVYLPIVRGQLNELLATFDFADPDLLVGQRDRTNVPSQALLMLNGRWVQDQVAELAAMLSQQSPEREAFIRAVYLQLLSRQPTESELQSLLQFLDSDDSVKRQQLVGAIVGCSEFRLVD